jgi:hypothetical protein
MKQVNCMACWETSERGEGSDEDELRKQDARREEERSLVEASLSPSKRQDIEEREARGRHVPGRRARPCAQQHVADGVGSGE